MLAGCLATLVAGWSAAWTRVEAAPVTPRRDDEVVERLPLRVGSSEERARQRAEQRVLAQQPRDLGLALRAAREAIERARRDGDPRELGTAQAWLRPWWDDPAAPPAARLLKAIVLQARHEFDAALAELDHVLATPRLPSAVEAQAALTRASLLQVRGRWDEARQGCQRLAGPPLSLPHGRACLAELDSLQGRDAQAMKQLSALERDPRAPQAWLMLLRAEMAERQGRPEAGELYARALALEEGIYVRAAYADWLLDAGRPADAAAVAMAGVAGTASAASEAAAPLAIENLPDALLLRVAIAWKRSSHPDAARAAAQMQSRFDAAALRGDTTHARERARFALDVRQDAAVALREATLNWTQQREPADAVLLMRASRAARRPEAAAPVMAFQREQGLRDRRLEAAR